jgi:hypothetical protein
VRFSHGHPNAWGMILENPETGKKLRKQRRNVTAGTSNFYTAILLHIKVGHISSASSSTARPRLRLLLTTAIHLPTVQTQPS